MFILGEGSKKNLTGVDPYLIAIVVGALKVSKVDFTVLEGVRTLERQKRLYAQGRTAPGNIVTWTMKSKHITGDAVDLYPWINGRVVDKDKQAFIEIRNAMFASAAQVGKPIRWGRDWDGDGIFEEKGEYDGPHFELV